MGSLVFSICQEDLAGAGGSFDKLQLNSWKKILRAILSGVGNVISGKGENMYITSFNYVFSIMLQASVVICECYIKNILKYMREVFLEPSSSFKRQPVI